VAKERTITGDVPVDAVVAQFATFVRALSPLTDQGDAG
jgi:hypothetical protein